MSASSDNFTALIYLKDQVRKWKTLCSIVFIAILLLSARMLFYSNDKHSDIESGGDYIASITIEGEISDDNYREEILNKIATQKNIKAVLINVNSPGGGIVGSEILYENLRDIVKKKPIVVMMGSVAASGAYMAAIASDYIIARNGTLTGSIGVIMQSSEVTDLASKLGVKFLTYKSSPLKGAPSPFEKSNPKVDEVIGESIKDSYKFFSDLVLERRKGKLNKKDIANIIDGRIFTGRQALKAGLVDEIGGKKEALAYLKKAYNIDGDKIDIRDITIEKQNGRFVDKILDGKSLAKVFGWHPKKEKIMAIFGS